MTEKYPIYKIKWYEESGEDDFYHYSFISEESPGKAKNRLKDYVSQNIDPFWKKKGFKKIANLVEIKETKFYAAEKGIIEEGIISNY